MTASDERIASLRARLAELKHDADDPQALSELVVLRAELRRLEAPRC